MDQIYYWIFILFIVIIILDYSDNYYKKKYLKKEYFNNQVISDSTVPPYYEENRLNIYEPPYSTNAVNINSNKNLNFKNFTTSGITPSFLKCPTCELQYDCSNFPYDIDDKNTSVCTKCYEKISFNNNNLPVYAKSVGKPRVCKNLIN